MNRIQQDSRRVVRTGTQYPATIIDVHGDRASAQLSGNGAKLHNLAVIGGPVEIGEAVSVDFTTPDPTIVATAKDWLTIEDILRALGKLPEPLMSESQIEFDKVVTFCIDDPTQFFILEPSYSGWFDAMNIVDADISDLGYARRWGLRIPPNFDWEWINGVPNALEIWYPMYVWGAGKEQVHIYLDDLHVSYGAYVENIYFDFWWEERFAYLNEGIHSFGFSWYDEITGNPIYSPSNNYLLLPDQVFNGQIFRNCKFRAGNGEYNPGGDEYQNYNDTCIIVENALDGYVWERTENDIMIFENCHFVTDPQGCYEPHLVQNYSPAAGSDGYRTQIYLYDCEVDCGPTPMPSVDLPADVHSIGTRWIGTNILDLNYHEILKTSDRAALDHIHGSSGSSGGYDENALHDNELGEIYMVTEKTDPVGADLLLIEDSEASYAKKKIQISNLPFSSGSGSSGSGGGATTFVGLTDTPSAYTGQGGKLVSVKNTVDGLEFINAPTAGSDGNAIHDNVADEIHQVTEKVTPADNDEILIEDSAASWAKKRLKISNLPSSGSGGGDMYKSTYDTNDDGKVNSADAADAVPWSGVSSKPDPLDATAIHDNVSAEISAVTEKASPVSGDLLLIEDSAASNAKKRAQVGNLPFSATGHTHLEANITDLDHTDANAIHDNVSAEISAVTEKASPVSADLILIEDSEASNAKKRVQIGNLPSSGSGSGSSTFLGLTDTPSSFSGQGGKYAKVNDGESALEFVTPDASAGGFAFIGTVLASGTAGSDGLTDITLDNIPAGYDYLDIYFHGNCTDTSVDSTGLYVEFNDDTTSTNYRRQRHSAGPGSTHSAGQGEDGSFGVLGSSKSDSTWSIGSSHGRIIGYDNDNFHKVIIGQSAHRFGDTTDYKEDRRVVWWENTAAITKMKFTVGNGNFAEGTSYVIIGYKNQAVPSGLVSDIGARVHLASDQTNIATSTTTAIDFDTEDYDTDNLWTSGSGSRFTINTAGKYHIWGSVQWESNVDNARTVYIRKNGSVDIAWERDGGSSTGDIKKMGVSTIIDLEIGDYVELTVRHTAGVALDIQASGITTAFAIQKISSGGGDADAIHDNVAGEISALTEKTVPVGADLVLIEDSEASNAKKKVQISKFADVGVVNGRLTLESGVPISTSDQSAKTTLYFTPYMGNNIGLFTSGSVGYVRDFSELSLSLTGLTASTPYDIWIYDNAGTLTLDKTAWTDDTTRATEIVQHNGIYVKSGDVTRRYLGTIYINSTGGQTEDTVVARYVWNYYNRSTKYMRKFSSSSHSYTTTTYRVWNNDATNRLSWVVGVEEDDVWISWMMGVQIDTVNWRVCGLGKDRTNGVDHPFYWEQISFDWNNVTNNAATSGAARMGMGKHYVQAMQYGASTITNWQYVNIDGHIKC